MLYYIFRILWFIMIYIYYYIFPYVIVDIDMGDEIISKYENL